MNNSMDFPNAWREFLQGYSFKDKEQIYTNGSELIPVFRVEQMIEHYFGEFANYRWVSVEDKLPEHGDTVVIETTPNNYYIATYSINPSGICIEESGVWFIHNTTSIRPLTKGVTRWAPLPVSPKEEHRMPLPKLPENLKECDHASEETLEVYRAYIEDKKGHIATRFLAYSTEDVEKQVKEYFGRNPQNKGKTAVILSIYGISRIKI